MYLPGCLIGHPFSFYAWARLRKCLGQESLPYMWVVMPPLLQSAHLKLDVTITDTDAERKGNESDDQNVCFDWTG